MQLHQAPGIVANDASLKASGDSTDGALSVFEITVEGGPPLHIQDHEHVYLLEGELSAICGDDLFEVPAGSFVFMPRARTPLLVHGWIGKGVLLIAVPGGIEDYFARAPLRRRERTNSGPGEIWDSCSGRIGMKPTADTQVTHRRVQTNGIDMRAVRAFGDIDIRVSCRLASPRCAAKGEALHARR